MSGPPIYVSGLPEGLDDSTFPLLFAGCGSIVASRLVAEKRCGFVTFSSAEEANAVVKKLNGVEYGGSKVTVKFAEPNDYGVETPPVGVGKGPAKSDATASFGKGSAAQGPAKAHQQSPPLHIPMHPGQPPPPVEPPPAQSPASQQAHHGDFPPCDQVYIKGLIPGQTSSEKLKEIFGFYGSVVWAKVFSRPDVASKGQTDVAAVQMSSVDEASWLVANLNGYIPRGLTHPVSVMFSRSHGHPKRKGGKGKVEKTASKTGGKNGSTRSVPYDHASVQGKGGKDGETELAPAIAAAFGLGGKTIYAAGGDESNLYVKGLPANADELYLYRIFARFGAIQSVKHVMNEWGGIGFVKFVKSENAQRAIASLHGSMQPDGNTIQVSVKLAGKRKEDNVAGKSGNARIAQQPLLTPNCINGDRQAQGIEENQEWSTSGEQILGEASEHMWSAGEQQWNSSDGRTSYPAQDNEQPDLATSYTIPVTLP